MNRCVELHEQLEDLALGSPATSELSAHLDECAGCVTELERQRALLLRLASAIDALVRVEPPAQLYAASSARSTPVRPRLAVWAVVAVCAVLFVIGFRMLDRPLAARSDLTALTQWHSPTAWLLEPSTTPLDVRPAPLLSPGGTHGS